jgi:cyclopropane-fatty-acyl-phospholipid synthase
MKTDKFEDASQKLLSLAEIKVNGDNPWDIKVHNKKFYQRVLSQGSLGLGACPSNASAEIRLYN